MKPENDLIFNLKNELTQAAPDVWHIIRKRIATNVVASLLNDLDGLPSPQGRLLSEINADLKEQMLQKQLGA